MPRTYTYTLALDRHDMLVLVGTLEYNKDDIIERIGELTGVDPMSEADQREVDSRQEELRVIRIVLSQYNDQTINGPMIGIDLRQDLAEPLQNALYTQLTYAQRQAARYLTMLATPGLPDAALGLINAEIKQYARQIEALEHVMRQIGRHV